MADHISSVSLIVPESTLGGVLMIGSGCDVDIAFSGIHLGCRSEDDTVIDCLLGFVVYNFFLS